MFCIKNTKENTYYIRQQASGLVVWNEIEFSKPKTWKTEEAARKALEKISLSLRNNVQVVFVADFKSAK